MSRQGQKLSFPVAAINTALSSDAGSATARELARKALISLNADRTGLACARERHLTLTSLSDGAAATDVVSQEVLYGNERVTALAWVTSAPSKHNRAQAELLMVGTSLGYLQIHSKTGAILGRQRLHQTACCSIQIRGSGQGLDSSNATQEITLGFALAVVRIPTIEVYSFNSQLSSMKEADTASSVEIGYTKWEFPRSTGVRHSVICLGPKAPSLREKMLGHISSPKLAILSGGEYPALSLHEAPEFGNEGVLAVVSELATGVAGLAKTLAKGRPNGYRAGIGNWLSRAPKQEQTDPAKVVTAPGHSSSLTLSVPDDARVVTAVAVCPRGPLAAAADSLGRVLLFNISTLTVLRMWKSYRHVQIGWLSLPAEGSSATHCLVLFSPSRARLELWEPHGRCLSDVPVCQDGVLLGQVPKLGDGHTADGPCLLDCQTGRLYTVANLLNSES